VNGNLDTDLFQQVAMMDQALDQINPSLNAGQFSPFLLAARPRCLQPDTLAA
jgi:hypothetical protein